MGLHSGPVNKIEDVNDRPNVAGAGINVAQRVLDCGDADHILLSKRLADDLAEYGHWRPHLHDLGDCVVKHGMKLQLVNFHDGTRGNPARPEKLQQADKSGDFGREKARWRRRASWLVGALLFLLAAALTAFLFLRMTPKIPPDLPEKGVAVLRF